MTNLVSSPQVQFPVSVNLTPALSPPCEPSFVDSSLLKVEQSLSVATTISLSTPQAASKDVKPSAVAGNKRKSEELVELSRGDFEYSLTNEDLVAIDKTSLTLPPLNSLDPIDMQSFPERSITKKSCFQRSSTHIHSQHLQSTNSLPPRIAAPTSFRFQATPGPKKTSSMPTKPTPIIPGMVGVTPQNSFNITLSTDVSARTKTKATNISKRNPLSKPQMKYDPEVPMSKQEAAAWRREQRRARNRESAAVSRQKIRNRIVELETEVNGWQKKYAEAMARVQILEGQQQRRCVVGGTVRTPIALADNSNNSSSMISPTGSRSTSPAPFKNVVPQVVPSLSRLSTDSRSSSCLSPVVNLCSPQDSAPPLQPYQQFNGSGLCRQQEINNPVLPHRPQLVTIPDWDQKLVKKIVQTNRTSLVVPDSCRSNVVISSASSSVANADNTTISVSESSEGDISATSVSPDFGENRMMSTNISSVNFFDEGGNVLDDILFNALDEIDSYANSACAL